MMLFQSLTVYNQNPTIYIGGFQIEEPITTITDIFFSTVCFFASYKTINISNSKALKLYSLFFLTTGISAIIAAIFGHALLYHFGKDAKIYGWILGIICVSISQFAALYHIKSILKNNLFKVLFIISWIETLIALITTFYFWTFIVVIIHSTFSLSLVVTSLEFINYKKTQSQVSKQILYGVGFAIIASLCHLFKLGFGIWFNHLDVSHVFMSVSIYTMYLGVKKLK